MVYDPFTRMSKKEEALKLEKNLINKYKPTINAEDTNFWKINKLINGNIRISTRKPKVRNIDKENKVEESYINIINKRNQEYTIYWYKNKRWYNFGNIIQEAFKNKELDINMKVTLGRKDITNWKAIRAYYGDSTMEIKTNDSIIYTNVYKYKSSQ